MSPSTSEDMSGTDWRGMIRGLLKFFLEEAKEPEHQGPTLDNQPMLTTSPSSGGPAAGVMVLDPEQRRVLFAKRSAEDEVEPGTWNFPAGSCEGEESARDCALRELREETGRDCGLDDLGELDARTVNGVPFTTFILRCPAFAPRLNEEHSSYRWAPWGQWPEPLHPGVEETFEALPSDFDEFMEAISPDVDPEKVEEDEAIYGNDPVVEDPGLGEVVADVETKRNPDGSIQPTANLGEILPLTTRRLREEGLLEAAQVHPGPKAHDAKPRYLLAFRPRRRDAIALDRGSMRSYDVDGRLHVKSSNLSKATVNDYLGHEIPDYEKLGLEPQRVYRLLRDPDEMRKALPTFNNLPILSRHVPVSAVEHRHDLVVGSTGSDAAMKGPYLTNSLSVWTAPDIEGIESGKKSELSCGYRYRADMTPGTYEGQRYDGIMRDIKGNHVSLVREGRAGHDVVVGDSRRPYRIVRFGLDDGSVKGKEFYEDHHNRSHGQFAPSEEGEASTKKKGETQAEQHARAKKTELSAKKPSGPESSSGQVPVKSYTISYGGTVLGRMSGTFDVQPEQR